MGKGRLAPFSINDYKGPWAKFLCSAEAPSQPHTLMYTASTLIYAGTAEPYEFSPAEPVD